MPTLNEKEIIAASLNNLSTLLPDLAKGIQVKLVVIDDGSDDGTAEILAPYQNDPLIKVITRQLPAARQGKGAALNAALDWINTLALDPQTTIIGVIDSDSDPDLHLFMQVLCAFRHSNYDLIQTGVEITHADHFLTLMQKFEFEIPNLLSQIIRSDWGSALASGNGQFMTLHMTQTVRWRKTLLEDLDFSLNGLFQGFYGGFLYDVLIPQEGVSSYRKLIKQRVRWCQGGMQCCSQYAKRVFHSKRIPPKLKSDIFAFMIMPFLAMIILPSSFISVIVMLILLVQNTWPTFLLLCVIFLINGAVAFAMYYSTAYLLKVDQVLEKKRNILKYAYGNLIYMYMLAPVPYIAFFRLLTGRDNWEKTSHTGKAGETK